MDQTANTNPTEITQNQLVSPSDPWSDQRALAIASGDFSEMETARRSQGHNRRFSTAEELYYGYCAQKYWEGTRIPRSSLGVPVAMDQIEALMPLLMSSIFPLRDNVQIWPLPGTSPEESQAAWDLMISQLEQANSREVSRQAFKSGLIYGNGIVEVCYKHTTKIRKRLIARWISPTREVQDPLTGRMVSIQVGSPRRVYEEVEYTEIESGPELKNVDIRDFYIDPNCASPDLQKASKLAVRGLVSINELAELRSVVDVKGKPIYNIPPDPVLAEMAKNKSTSTSDTEKGNAEVYRGLSYRAAEDFTVDPNAKRIEVIRYFTKDRCVWLLNRKWVAFNRANPYGFYPFLNAFYVDAPNRFYGLAVTDVVEGEQRLQQGVINARIDELSLTIHPPIVKKRGSFLSQGANRMYPGKVMESENPREDWIKQEYPNITGNAYVEVNESSNRAQKRTGVTDMAVLGMGTAGGNSANRTATGVNTQSAAAGNRLRYQVENLEYNFVEPLLVMIHSMNQQFLDPDQVLTVLGDSGRALQIDPLNVKNARVKFVLRAADKMKSRVAWMQMFPLLAQTFLNPATIQMLAQQQAITPDMMGWIKTTCDAMQMPETVLFRKMSQNEVQGMMAQQLAPQMMDLMAQRERFAAMSADKDSADETKLINTALGKLVTPEAAHAMLGIEMPKPRANGR